MGFGKPLPKQMEFPLWYLSQVCLIISFVIIYLMFDSPMGYKCYEVRNCIHPFNLILVVPIATIGSQ